MSFVSRHRRRASAPGFSRCAAGAALALAALARSAGADLVLNEVLYDPSGADEGREFVELFNPDSTAIPLEGVSLEAGDGARPGVWEVVWSAPAGEAAGPRSAFLVAGVALTGALQNGPDALRLTRGGSVLDLLGYGDLESAALYEGSPAPDAGSGQSLGRVRDGVDSGVNGEDWAVENDPTPGFANHPDERLRLSRSGFTPSPEVAWPGETVALHPVVRNSGRFAIEGARWTIEAEVAAAASHHSDTVWTAAASRSGVTTASAESAAVSLQLVAPAAGVWRVRVRTSVADGVGNAPAVAAALADTVVAEIRVVAGPVVVNEIAFRDAGAGEWIEIWFREAVDDIGSLAMADAVAMPRPVDRGAAPRRVERGAFLVVAQDPALVRVRYGLADSIVVGLIGGWPSLNDAGVGDAPADRVRVVDAGGAPCDAVSYREDSSARGRSIERLSADLPSAAAGSWIETIDPRGGTPGRENSMRAPGAGAAAREPLLVAGARVLRRRSGAEVPVVLRATAATRGRRLTVRVHDLLGRRLRTLVEGQRFPSEGSFVWDGRDDRGAPVPPGLYVIRAEALPEDGAEARASALPMAVAAERTP